MQLCRHEGLISQLWAPLQFLGFYIRRGPMSYVSLFGVIWGKMTKLVNYHNHNLEILWQMASNNIPRMFGHLKIAKQRRWYDFFLCGKLCYAFAKSPGLPVRQARQALVDLEDARALLSQEVWGLFFGCHVSTDATPSWLFYLWDSATQLRKECHKGFEHSLIWLVFLWQNTCFSGNSSSLTHPKRFLPCPVTRFGDKPFQHLPKFLNGPNMWRCRRQLH